MIGHIVASVWTQFDDNLLGSVGPATVWQAAIVQVNQDHTARERERAHASVMVGSCDPQVINLCIVMLATEPAVLSKSNLPFFG